MEAATALYGKARVADRIPQLANVVISNVPGPQDAAVHGRRAHADQLPDLDRRARHGAEHHGAELRPVAGLRAHGRRAGYARRAELADAIRIAFDDLQALPLPGEEGDEAADPASMIMRAAKSLGSTLGGTLGGAMGKVAKGVVDTAVEQAVSQVTGRGLKSRVATPARRRGRG
jgi:diacylglycerol O-acyltransferase / wax synthase